MKKLAQIQKFDTHPPEVGKDGPNCNGSGQKEKIHNYNNYNNYNYNNYNLFKNKKRNYNYNYDNYEGKTGTADELIPLAQLPQPCRHVVEAWNQLRLKQFTGLFPVILYSVNNLLEQYGEETVVETIHSIAQSPFLLGHNDTPNHWCATFTWLLRQNNFEKVLQGVYHKHVPCGFNRCAERAGENFAAGPFVAESGKDEKNMNGSCPAEEQKARSRKEARPANVLLENMARTLGVKY